MLLAVVALVGAVPSQAAAPTLSKRVTALEAQVRSLNAQLGQMQTSLNRTNCNIATLYATVARIYQTFGEQIAGLSGKTLTPATLPPYDDGGACKH